KLLEISRQVQRLRSDWDIFYLGHFPLYGCFPMGKRLWRVRSVLLYGYIQSTKWMDKFQGMTFLAHSKKPVAENTNQAANQTTKETPLDLWVLLNTQQWAHSPMIAGQSNHYPLPASVINA